MSGALKSLAISAPGTSFCVVLHGAEPSALVQAVTARLGFDFFLTEGPERSDRVVPLTAALPDGMQLTAHEATASPAPSLASLLATTAEQSLPRAPPKPPLPPSAEGRRNVPGADNREVAGAVGAEVGRPRTSSAPDGPRARAGLAPDWPRDLELQQPLLPEAPGTPTTVGRRRLSSMESIRSWVSGDLWKTRLDVAEGDPKDIRSPRSELNKQTAQMCDAVQRFNRLSTDLANERTLLAWVRTCLAAIRTVFTYLVLHALSAREHWSLVGTEVAMAALIVVCALTGANRYYRLKDIILQKDIVAEGFGRLSMRPLNIIVILTSVSTAVGIVTQQWVKG